MNRTDTLLIPVIDGDAVTLPDDTAPMPFPWARPVVTRYSTRRPAWARVRRSQFAADLTSAARFAGQLVVSVAVVIGLIVLLRGAYVAAQLFGVAP